MLERLAAIGTYTAAVVHELSNPLAAARAALGSARRASGEEELSHWLDAIEEATEREALLLESVIRFAREGILRRQDAELEGILRCAEHAVRDDVGVADLSVQIEIAAGAERAYCNPAALEQVLIDLLRNAAEASSASARVLISARREGDSIALAISDDGPGLHEADPEKVFAPGYSTKANHAGLGLFFARALVTAQNGQIVAQRGEQGGTEFVLRLPGAAPCAK
jgi:two-component system C4-dicarboxylate transport sensor histidine kinase DctB